MVKTTKKSKGMVSTKIQETSCYHGRGMQLQRAYQGLEGSGHVHFFISFDYFFVFINILLIMIKYT